MEKSFDSEGCNFGVIWMVMICRSANGGGGFAFVQECGEEVSTEKRSEGAERF